MKDLDNNGFTLVELLVAIGILAIVAIPVSNALVKTYGNIHRFGRESADLLVDQGELEKLYTSHNPMGNNVIKLDFSNRDTSYVIGDIVASGDLEGFVIGAEIVNVGSGIVDPDKTDFKAGKNQSGNFDFKMNVHAIKESGFAKITGIPTSEFKFFILEPNGNETFINIVMLEENGTSGNYDVIISIPNNFLNRNNLKLGAIVLGVRINNYMDLKF